MDVVREQLEAIGDSFASTKTTTEWDRKGILDSMLFLFDSTLGIDEQFWIQVGTRNQLVEEMMKRAEARYAARETEMTPEVMRQLEQYIYLGSIDALWKDHLLNMDHLKEGVGLRGYGQKDPLVEYKKEGFTLFKMMDEQSKTDVITKLYRVQVTREAQVEEMQPKKQAPMTFTHGSGDSGAASSAPPATRDEDKVGRNDPCPCGSGKKYKKCHGR
jgi:preprotein translocase subunit SecA